MTGAVQAAAAAAAAAGVEQFTPTISNQTMGSSGTFPSVGQVTIRFNGTTGAAEYELGVGGGFNAMSTAAWDGGFSGTISALWQIRLTVSSGTSPSSGDSVGSWLTLGGQTISWVVTRDSLGASIGDWLVEIRYAGGRVLDSATYSVTASQGAP